MIRRMSMSSPAAIGSVVSILVALALCQPPDQRNLPMMIANRYSRRSHHRFTRRHIPHHAALPGNSGAAADRQVTGQSDLPADHHMVAQPGAAGDAGLRDQYAATAHLDVVPDLYQ